MSNFAMDSDKKKKGEKKRGKGREGMEGGEGRERGEGHTLSQKVKTRREKTHEKGWCW